MLMRREIVNSLHSEDLMQADGADLSFILEPYLLFLLEFFF